MARIRTIKPEAFESEDLAAVNVTAERTFFGLLTLADDAGRFRDHPAIIAGRLWALRPEHTATHVAGDLEQLAETGLVCRYTGCDGRTYLHIVTWERHQRIDRPSASRLPRCPHHQAAHKCGGCTGERCPSAAPATTGAAIPGRAHRALVEPSPSPPHTPETPISPGSGAVGERRTAADEPASTTRASSTGDQRDLPTHTGESAGRESFGEDSPRSRRDLGEPSPPGSRILDPGSVPTGREAPAPDTTPGAVCAKDLLAEYVRGCAHRPPEDVLGLLGRKIKTLLGEGFEPEPIRAGLERMRAKGLHASLLPSLVNEVLNASPPPSTSPPPSASRPGPWASSGATYTPYLNPTAPEPTTFGGRP